MTRLGFLGPRGTFGEQAALLHDSAADLVPLPSNGAVVRAVLEGAVDESIAPVENSLEGSVSETVDALVQSERIFIRRELVVPVEHCLIAAKGTRIEDVKVVMSHPQALAQCRAFLEKMLPDARLEAALSTAAAVEAASRTPATAAIGTRRAAELAGAQILAVGVQDGTMNKTRFVVLGLSDAEVTGDDKTSVAFTVAHDRPGTLLGVLKELSDRSINMTRIESRPSREDLGIYVFLVDFEGHRKEPAAADAIEAVKAKSFYFRVLGSYPRFREAPKP